LALYVALILHVPGQRRHPKSVGSFATSGYRQALHQKKPASEPKLLSLRGANPVRCSKILASTETTPGPSFSEPPSHRVV